MAIAKWSQPSTRSSNLAGVTLNGLANNTESNAVTYDNLSARSLYAAVTIRLGSISPTAGGSITLRVTSSDGVDVSDRIGGDVYVAALTSGATAKTVVIPLVRIYPFSLRVSVINNAGVALAGSGNEIYVTPYGEEVV